MPPAHFDQTHAAGLMRVNHVGEVCAQALYSAQALCAKSPRMAAELADAAAQERDHLAWTERRLTELNARPSLLNPLWYAGSFGLGVLAACVSDRLSLGFVAETERQVADHLAGHLGEWPPGDAQSIAIVEAMRRDEVAHADHANALGAMALPLPIKTAMRLAARVMTTTAYRI